MEQLPFFSITFDKDDARALQHILALSKAAEHMILGIQNDANYIALNPLALNLKKRIKDEIHKKGWCMDMGCTENVKEGDVQSKDIFGNLNK
jgi:hypothetical protein